MYPTVRAGKRRHTHLALVSCQALGPPGVRPQLFDQMIDSFGGLDWIVVFPHADYDPPGCRQFLICLGITDSVCVDLLAPEVSITCRRAVMVRASMPEATVHEDGDLVAREDHVRGGATFTHRLSVDQIAQPTAVERPTERQFWPGVSAAIGAHDSADRRRGSPRPLWQRLIRH